MPTVFHPKTVDKVKQVRLSLPKSTITWLEEQAATHGLTLHEAATQALVFARNAVEAPPEPSIPATTRRRKAAPAAVN